MTREQELMEYLGGEKALAPVVRRLVCLEQKMEELEGLPWIRFSKDRQLQKITPAAKLYKDLMNQYVYALNVVRRVSGADDMAEESPLRKWVNEHLDA